MNDFRLQRLWPTALIALACAAQAQTAPATGTTAASAATSTATAAPRSPLDPAAPTPKWVYRSPFDAARAVGSAENTTDAAMGWIDANQQVRTIGGWRAYAREAQAPELAASAPASTSSPPAMQEPGKPAPPMPAMQGHQHHGGGKP